MRPFPEYSGENCPGCGGNIAGLYRCRCGFDIRSIETCTCPLCNSNQEMLGSTMDKYRFTLSKMRGIPDD